MAFVACFLGRKYF